MKDFNSGIRRKDWEKGKYIACDKGIQFSTKDCPHGRTPDRFYDQDGNFYSTLDELLSSVGLDPGYMFSEEDDYEIC